ncbi:MAG: hypothetical protein JWQ25_1414 [Daejeonella sp.]|nr:hypothetical protein [Daejeonella sp.]
MLNKISHYLLSFLIVFALGCSSTKNLPKGEKLYIGHVVSIEGKDIKKSEKKALKTELTGLVRPKPNSSILGMRFKLWIYNLAGTPKKAKGGLRNYLRNKLGEPPVLASSVNLQTNQEILTNRLQNKGYFQASVSGDTTSKGKKVKAKYAAQIGPQYIISSVNFPVDSGDLEKAVAATADKSILKVKEPYNLDVIKGERERIDQTLKEQGFYFFGPDYLLIRADSTIGEHKVNLYVTVKPTTPQVARQIYTIGNVYIYPNYSLNQTQADTAKNDAVMFGGYYVIDKDSTFKPPLFRRSMLFEPGEIYNRTDHNLSLNRLVTLGAFKFVKNRFEVDTATTVPRLDASYYLTPLPRKSFRGEVTGTSKSNNLNGSEVSLSWKNRNTFRGAEQLSVRAYGGFEVQVSGNQSGYNTFRLGGESILSIPKFVVPFFKFNTTNAFVPRTKFTLGYELFNRQNLYTLNSFRGSAGYNWKENIRKEHELSPISINYVQPLNVSALYDTLVNHDKTGTLRKTIEKQFIMGSTYSFTYNNQIETARRNHTFFNANVDIAGNIPGLITNPNWRTNDTVTIFKARFAQYIRVDGDFRYYYKLGRNSQLANRAIAGFGLPYGNSQELPFIKQYFVGGSNSVRAFRSRSVGPGSSDPNAGGNNSFTPDQSGDIKLELNTEYRAKLAGVVNGAIFLDAGNVWLYNEKQGKAGAKFSKDFLKELAVGAGVGLRFDLSFLVLRTDLAMPLRKPWLPEGSRSVLNQINFGDKNWRKENLVFNLAIGYPF